MSHTIELQISTEFSAGVDVDTFDPELAALDLKDDLLNPVTFLGVLSGQRADGTPDVDYLRIELGAEPDAAGLAAIDGVVAAHTGDIQHVCARLGAITGLLIPTPLPFGTTWGVLFEAMERPGLLHPSAAEIMACVAGTHQTTWDGTGDAPQLRLVEDPGHEVGGEWVYDGTDDRVIATIDLADTGLATVEMHLAHDPTVTALTVQPHDCRYRVEGRLNHGALCLVGVARMDFMRWRL